MVSNWKEVYKSYAVLFPAVAVAAINILDASVSANLVPTSLIPVVVLFTGGLGWVIRQNNIRK
jgi:hypothetical protein